MGAPHDPELEGEIDRLYGLPLEEFTPARNALAARLKKAGAREAAARVAGLGKPSVSAWAVNQLRRHRRARLDALLAAGERARDAQREALRGGGGEALRDALREQRDAIAALRRDAAELLAAAGHAAGDAVLERIETSLQALASDPGALAALGEGRLARDLEPPGFDALAGLAAGLAPVTRPARPEPAAPSAPPAKAPPVHAPPPRIPVASRSEADERAAEEAAPAAAPTKEMSAAKRRELQAIADEETGREATARRAERARRLAQARKDHAEAKRTLEQAEKRARAHAEELQEVEQRAARMRRAAQAAEAAATQAEEAAAEARAGARQALERLERAREALATAEAKLRDDDPQPM